MFDESGARSANILDPAQLVRIEAVHRGFLFQHLYTVQCLLSAAALSVQSVKVESDEDVEVQFEGRRIYVQMKHRKEPLAWNDIEEALTRFGQLRAAHERGEREGRVELRLIDSFHSMIRKKMADDLEPWIVCASNSLIASFANGILRDGAAVRAAITELGPTGKPRVRSRSSSW